MVWCKMLLLAVLEYTVTLLMLHDMIKLLIGDIVIDLII